jgi:arsenate reductase (thioredoxin)
VSKPRVLFLCSGNTARSQMAEAFLRAYAGDHFDVYSAGLQPTEINLLTMRVMQELGFDMAGHRSKGLTEFLGKVHFGYLITVCQRAQEMCPVFPGVAKRLFWPFEDPAQAQGTEEERLAVFRRVRDAIDDRIRRWVQDELRLPLGARPTPVRATDKLDEESPA